MKNLTTFLAVINFLCLPTNYLCAKRVIIKNNGFTTMVVSYRDRDAEKEDVIDQEESLSIRFNERYSLTLFSINPFVQFTRDRIEDLEATGVLHIIQRTGDDNLVYFQGYSTTSEEDNNWRLVFSEPVCPEMPPAREEEFGFEEHEQPEDPFGTD